MHRLPTLFAVLALGAAASLVFAGEGSSKGTALPTLYVTYSAKCTFTITSDSGGAVTSIPYGTYQVQVTTPGSFSGVDLAGITDFTACKGAAAFQLTGPGVNVATTLNDGDASQDVLNATFQASSTYAAQDNNQPSATHTTFTTTATAVGATSTTTTPTTTTSTGTKTTPTSSAKVVGTITATVTAAGNVTLTYKKKIVTSLTPGAYTLSVVDKSKKAGFTIQGGGKKTVVTTAAFVGKKPATITLKTGQWFAFGVAKGAKYGFVVAGGGLYG
jgi:hypothetical protein